MLAAAILFGVAANADNLSVGIGYGLKLRRIRWRHNTLIAAITTTITLVAFAAGHELRDYVVPSRFNWIGGTLLIVFAVWNLFRDHARRSVFPPVPADVGGYAGLHEVLVLALALSVNNIGLAVAGGIGGIGYREALSSIFVMSIALLAAGQIFGKRMASVGGTLSSPLIGDCVLLIAGILMIVGY